MLPGSTGQTCKFPSLTCLKKLTVYFEILMALRNSSDKGFIFLAVRKTDSSLIWDSSFFTAK